MKKILVTILFLLNLHRAYAQQTQYDSLKNLISSAKDDTTKFWKTYDLIWFYLYSIPDSAVTYVQQNILLAQKMKSDLALFSAYYQYSGLEQINGNYPQALQYGLECLRVAERKKDFFLIVIIYDSMGDIYQEAGDFKNAIAYLQKAKSLLELRWKPAFTQVKNRDTIQQYFYILLHSAQTYEKFNHLDSALKYAKNLYNAYSTVFDKMDWAPLLYTMGNIYSKIGDYPAALNYYRSGAASSGSNKKDLMDNHNGIAMVLKKMGELDSSIFYANKVLEASEVAGNLLIMMNVFDLMADVYKLKRNTDSVAKYLELMITTKDSLFNQQKVMQVQSMTFNEELRRQEIKDQQEQYQNSLRTYMLSGGLIVVLLLAGILYRNNLQKQKAKVKIEKAYEELKTTQAQLIQSEKMASLGQVTAGIAHEIQNPLNFVNNFSEVNKELIDELRVEQKKETRNPENENDILNNIEDNLEKINHHGKRADAIVKGMLQHSQTSTGKKEPTDINKLADEYLRLSYHGLRAKDNSFNVTMKTDFDETIGNINIIPQDMGRVLLNLYNNAFYAVNEKNLSAVTTPTVVKYEPTVSVSTKKVNNKVEIKVTDNGNGISQNFTNKIFQPFFTTKPTGQGTGLGLSLAYDIVKAHGGELSVETQEARPDEPVGRGKGICFKVQLPA